MTTNSAECQATYGPQAATHHRVDNEVAATHHDATNDADSRRLVNQLISEVVDSVTRRLGRDVISREPLRRGAALAIAGDIAKTDPSTFARLPGTLFATLFRELGTEADDLRSLALILNDELSRIFSAATAAAIELELEIVPRVRARERLALARDLHDRIAHGLAIALQHIEVARNVHHGPRRELDSAAVQVRQTVDDVRNISGNLRLQVGNRSIDDALRDYLDRIPVSPPVLLRSTGSPSPLPTLVAEELFVISLEAIRNARQHAQSRQILVSLEWEPSRLVVQVCDDGIGLPRRPRTSASGGMKSMQERAILIGARLNVNSDREGTVVQVDVQFPARWQASCP